LGRALRVNFQRRQVAHGGNRGDVVADINAEYLPHVRCGISADQQHTPALLRQQDGRRASQRGLADSAFAGKEEKPGSCI